MSKVVITLGVLVLGSGVSLTGAYALGAFDPDYELPIKKFEESKAEEIRTAIKDEGCVQSLFPNVSYASTVTSIGASDLSNNFFNASDTKATRKGCLVVNWDKGPEENSKGQGTFRFLWSMREDKNDGSKGFIVFATGDTFLDNNNKQMQFKAVAYTTKLENGKWTIEKEEKQFTEGQKKLDKIKFPKAGDDLEGVKDLENQDYWGLIEENKWDDMKSLDDAKRKEKAPDNFRGYWTWEGGSEQGKSAHSGSKGWDEWCKDVFGSDKVKIKDAVEAVKGKGIKKIVYSSVKIKAA